MSVSRIISRHGLPVNPPKGYRRGVSLPAKAEAPAIAVWAVRAMIGLFVMSVSYMSFALLWNMQLESSRQLDATYVSRMRSAEASTSDLKGTIQMLGSRNSIDQWAQDNGFVLAGSAESATLDSPQSSVSR